MLAHCLSLTVLSTLVISFTGSKLLLHNETHAFASHIESSLTTYNSQVWDFRFNHIPLTRHTPFSYGAGAAGAGGFESAVFTRKAGWGFEEAYGGAPFDAAHGLRGQAMGFNQGAPGRHGGAGIMGNKLDHDVERNGGGGGATTTGHEHKGHGLGHHHTRNDEYDTNGTGVNGNNSTGGGGLTGHGHQRGYDNNNGTSPINKRNEGLSSTRNDGLANTRNDGVTTNRDSQQYDNRSTTPTGTGDGRYHHHSRSLERKQIPPVPGQGGNVRNNEQY